MDEQFIECPQCGTKIKLSEALSGKIRDDIEKELRENFLKEQDKLKKRLEEDLRLQFDSDIAELKGELERKQEASEKAKRKLEEELSSKFALDMADLKEQLASKQEVIEKANAEELKLRKRVRDVEEKEKNIDLEMERKVSEEREKFGSEQRLKDLEKDKMINDLRDQIGDLKRKAEQGSMQLQGEVLEVDFEDFLRSRYPGDEISEVPKGVEGADIIHRVKNFHEECGVILWEIKNTKAFSDKWVDKLKEDQAKLKASAAVIVTKALPLGVHILCNMKGIWVLSYSFATEFVEIIRGNILAIANVSIAQVGKEEKMEAVYDYLSGELFRQRIEGIVQTFTNMQEELEREKRAMKKNWAAREMSIERIINNTARMYGDIQGIVGVSFPRISSLELDGGESLSIE